MIVSFNFYYAQPGLADAVLRQRLRACDVRDNLEIPRGRVLVRQSGSDELPDVVWELEFPDVDGHHADMAVRAGSAEFEAVRAGMRKLCRRFERPLFEIRGSAGREGADTSGFITLDWVFGGADAEAQVGDMLQAQLTSDGARRSQLLRLITPGDDLPSWVLKREYADAAGSDPQWRDGLSRIAHRVEHSTWSTA